MSETYRLKVAGLERDLNICPLNENLSIAGFIMFSDVELTKACAEALLKKVPEFDVMLTAESKGIPLAYEMARQSGKNYFVARKMHKLYMKNPTVVEVKSITTEAVQTLYLDEADIEAIRGKRLLLVDDVISTGESIHALEVIAEAANANIVGRATVLAEGDAADRDDIVYLEPLPLFFK
ncbi:MAG: adenine phosphoribosyltransferase [Oscillospiraceae bacterium]|nr:adenine phosphoribosyltransferase [Oscillospiraceae bacterium]